MKNKKKYSITIGIPAYNEEQNIGHLLVSILKQKVFYGVVKKILVISDGSTDDTVSIVRKFSDKRIKILPRKKRLGLNITENQLVKTTETDILILLNADVLPTNSNFIDELIKPIIFQKNVGLVSCETVSSRPTGLTDRVFGNSHIFKQFIFKRINNGNNIYLCHGRARAFKRELYKKIKWPKKCPEDAFSYLFCITQGMKFIYTSKAKVLFRSPSTIRDHIKQSTRFVAGNKILEEYFNPKMVQDSFHLPKSLVFKSLVIFLVTRPFSMSVYLVLSFYISLFARKNANSQAYDISLSTKKLISVNLVLSYLIDRL